MSSEEAVREKKTALRKEVRAKLKSLSDSEVDRQSQMVWERLFELDEYKSAHSIGLFLSMPSGEIKTDLAIENAGKLGKLVYVPQVGKNFEQADMEMLQVPVLTQDGALAHHNWPRNKWGIPEPPPDMELRPAQAGDIDLLVVPGLAFDRRGDRLGQGKGYYDRFIAKQTPVPKLVAVGLDCQLVDSIPTNPYDRRMDIILLPSEMIVPTSD